jgi:hypothetical protein
VGDDNSGLRDFLNFQPGEHYKRFVSAIFTVSPAFGNGGIEELGKHSIGINGLAAGFGGLGRLGGLKQASTLEFSETFQFATGKTGQEIEN